MLILQFFSNRNTQKQFRNSLRTFIILSFLIAFTAHAQNHFTILAGPSIATMSGSYIKESGTREWGFTAWFLLDKEFNSRWSFEVGFGVVQKGAKNLLLSTETSDSTYGYQTMYMQVPLLMKAKFPFANGKWFVAPYSGLAVSFNTGCKWKPGNQFEFEEEPCDETTPGGKIEKLELGIPLGAHIWREFPGGSRFMFDVHYEFGLTNVFEGAAEVNEAARNSVLILMAGFAVPLQ